MPQPMYPQPPPNPRKEPPIPIASEVGWAPELLWTFWKRDKSLIPASTEPRIIQPTAHSLCWLHYQSITVSVKNSKCTFCTWQSRKKNYTNVSISKMYTIVQTAHNARLETDNKPHDLVPTELDCNLKPRK